MVNASTSLQVSVAQTSRHRFAGIEQWNSNHPISNPPTMDLLTRLPRLSRFVPTAASPCFTPSGGTLGHFNVRRNAH
jgi:hypothetical protein